MWPAASGASRRARPTKKTAVMVCPGREKLTRPSFRPSGHATYAAAALAVGSWDLVSQKSKVVAEDLEFFVIPIRPPLGKALFSFFFFGMAWLNIFMSSSEMYIYFDLPEHSTK